MGYRRLPRTGTLGNDEGDANVNARETAKDYNARGWAVAPLPPREKGCVIDGWSTRTFVPEDFTPDANVGVKLGAPSGGLLDVDLDDPDAYELAREFLPATGATFGHGQRPQSHWLYVCDSPGRTRQWKAADGAMIVELRATGVLTMFPPSIHPSGEPVDWCTDGAPAHVERGELEAACEQLATAVRANRGDPPASEGASPPQAPVATAGPQAHQRLLDRAALYVGNAKSSVEGGRNSQAFSLAGHLAAFCDGAERLTEDDIVDLMQTRWNCRNSPPLDDAELVACVASARKNGAPRNEHAPRADAYADTPIIRPMFKTIRELVNDHPRLRPPVIHGLLREGETLNVIAQSKKGKSWLVGDLALALATGLPWMGQFQTERGDVLILDNELHRETTAFRIPKIAEARGIAPADYDEHVVVDNLRGRLLNIFGLPAYLAGVQPGRFKVIVLDALYRFWPPGTSENDNAAIAGFYNIIDNLAGRLNSCFVLIHHSSKGAQGSKALVDVGAGAGAIARAADCHLTLLSHETDTVKTPAVVLDAGPRSWPPVEPICLRFTWPVWTHAPELDPTALKPDRPRRPKQEKAVESETAPPKVSYDAAGFVTAFLTMEPKPRAAIIASAVDKGLSERRAEKLLKSAEGQGKAHRWRVGKTNLAYFANCPQAKLIDEPEAVK